MNFKSVVVIFALILSISLVSAESCSKIGDKCFSHSECCPTLACMSYLKKCVSSRMVERLHPPTECLKDGAKCESSKDCCTKFCSAAGTCGKDIDNDVCKPIGGFCMVSDDCCKPLRCHFFAAKCVT